MQKQIKKGRWIEVDTSSGTVFIERDLVDVLTADSLMPYCSGEIYSVNELEGYGARLSAPGYLDCTEWEVFGTEQDALDYLTVLAESDDTDNE